MSGQLISSKYHKPAEQINQFRVKLTLRDFTQLCPWFLGVLLFEELPSKKSGSRTITSALCCNRVIYLDLHIQEAQRQEQDNLIMMTRSFYSNGL